MGCENCASNINGLPKGCQNNGLCKSGGCNKLNSYDWLANIEFMDEPKIPDILEIKFKGTRKGFYKNPKKLNLEIGDFVVVDATAGGYDIGHVGLRSDLVYHQMKKYGVEADNPQMLTIQRRAGEEDMKKYRQAREQEDETMFKARKVAKALGLEMKISDVEYQCDLSKATFYYTAEKRVDFRELIKQLANTFKIKVEMKQIGLRQEAGRLGGIGSCGRELCCSTWLTDFDSVPTVAARYQNLFINPVKLAGQCGRLKCCLNYELDTYLEALEAFPDENTIIKTENGPAKILKTDILKGMVWLTYQSDDPAQAGMMVGFDVSKVNEFISKNKKGEKTPPLEAFSDAATTVAENVSFKDAVGEGNLNRFDKKEKKSSGGRGKGKGKRPSGNERKKRPPRSNQNRK